MDEIEARYQREAVEQQQQMDSELIGMLRPLTEDEFASLIPGGSRYCEDFPCCGHEAGDCDGSKYGSDEDIKARALERMRMEDEGYFYDDEEGY